MLAPVLRRIATSVSAALLLLAPASPAHAAEPPGTPLAVTALSTIEGVRVSWQAPGTAPGRPLPTGWVVRRTSAAGERTWTLPLGRYPWQLDDDELGAGVEAHYTVAATAAGVEGPVSDPAVGSRAVDARPFEPARDALVVVWDHEDATHRGATLVGPALEATPVAGGVAVTRANSSGSGPRFTVPWPIADGAYPVGTGTDEVPVGVEGAVGTCAATSGRLTVAHATPSRSSWWAAVTLDADLGCPDGSRVRASGRLATPEPVTAIEGDVVAALAAAPGTGTVLDHVVRNTGQRPQTVRGVRLLPSGVPGTTSGADPTGVLSVGTGSCAGVLAPGASCRLRLREDRPSGATADTEYTARVVLATDDGQWTVGTAVGTDRVELAAPQDLVATGRPGLTALTWRTGTAQDVAMQFSVLDESGTVRATSLSSTTAGVTLSPGAHTLRVRATLTDGRVYTSAPRTVVVPEEWILGDSGTGVRAIAAGTGPDLVEGRQVGEWEGGRTMTAVALASSPTRAESVGTDRYRPAAWFFSSSTITRLVRPDAMWATPRFRPDGAVLAVQRPARAPDGTTYPPAILLQDRATGTVTEVPGSSTWALADWTPDGRDLLVVGAAGGLYRMDPATGRTTGIRGAEDVTGARVSRTGRLAVVGPGGFTIETMPLSGGTRTPTSIYVWGREFAWNASGTMIAVGSPAWMTTGTGELWDLTGAPRKLRDIPTSRSVAWFDPVSSAPTLRVTLPRATTPTPTVAIAVSDPDDAPGGLRTTCALDGAAPAPCGASWRPGTLRPGTHHVTVRVTDPSGAATQRTVPFTVYRPTPPRRPSTPVRLPSRSTR